MTTEAEPKRKRVKCTLPTRIYKYGARLVKAPPVDDFLSPSGILFSGNLYRNMLVGLERDRRGEVDALLHRLEPELSSLDAEVVRLDTEIEQIYADARRMNMIIKKRITHPEKRKAVDALACERKPLYARLKEIKARLYSNPEFKREDKDIEIRFKERWKAARTTIRTERKLFYGSYVAVEEARRSDRQGEPPVFRRFDREGRIAMQIQYGMSPADLFSCQDTRLQIDPKLEGGGKNPWRTGRIRIGTKSESRAPIWLEFQVKLHRDIPEDALIKWAWLKADKVATHTNWSLQLVLSRASWDDARRASSGVIAIDVGWRKLNTGLRVAHWADDSGREGEVIIPAERIERWRKVEDLQSIRDKNFNIARTLLQEAKPGWPAWLAERLKDLHAWKSQARLASVVLAWREQRYDGDSAIYTAMEAWRKQDKHLYEWEEHQRQGEQDWRKNMYREFASRISHEYSTAIIEKVDWRHFSRSPDVLDEVKVDSPRWYNRIAAVSILNEAIKMKMRETLKAPPEWTTQACSGCGQIDNFDAAKELTHTCSKCEKTWDQDANACRNLLTLHASGVAVA